jgi:hypothetical protein
MVVDEGLPVSEDVFESVYINIGGIIAKNALQGLKSGTMVLIGLWGDGAGLQMLQELCYKKS